MIKKKFFLFFFFIIYGCSSFEFVYDKNPVIESIEDNVIYNVNGDESETILSYLNNKIGTSKSLGKFLLKIESEKTSTNIVIQENQTASQIKISHTLQYILSKPIKNCNIFKKEITTSIIYSAKSSGYSFGTDSSKNEIIKKNIQTNIDNLLSYIITNYSILDCQDEN